MTDETQPHPTRRPVRRVLAVIGVVVLVLAALSGIAWATRSTDQATVSIDESFSRVEIDVSAGTVELVGTSDDGATLESRTEHSWFSDASVKHEIDGDTLHITGDCSGTLVLSAWCVTNVTLSLPADVEVVAKSSAGTVTARGLEGETRLESSAGVVRVEDQSGDLTAHSSAGRVVVDGLSADTANVTSSAGTVEIHAVQPPRSLDAESSAGTVRVSLPDGVSYDIDADTSAGSTTVDAPSDPSSQYKVRAFSSAGSVTVTTGD
ncbi:MAG TPA: DUF4097 family beta strand repeat-containing protein [Jiangellaceae bacterium]|nr:DUF4097 family beta strand repeat-containing protein [Jiangellaceae bacterium]